MYKVLLEFTQDAVLTCGFYGSHTFKKGEIVHAEIHDRGVTLLVTHEGGVKKWSPLFKVKQISQNTVIKKGITE